MANTRNFTIGDIEYNDFTFPGILKQAMKITPVYDSSDTYVKYVNYRLRIEFVLVPEDINYASLHGTTFMTDEPAPTAAGTIDTTDGAMDQLRHRIMVPGKKLVIKRKGSGTDITINGNPVQPLGRVDGIEQWDADLGPKPRVLDWTPVGQNLAATVVWEVEFSLVECEDDGPPISLIGGPWPCAITYGIDWSIDDSGLTTRTLAGEIEVPIRRAASAGPFGAPLISSIKLQDVVDQYRNWIEGIVEAPLGFTRSQSYKMSSNKKILSFQIRDSEIESDEAYFPGCLKIACKHRTNSSFTGGPMGASAFNVWTCSLDCSITLRKGEARGKAWELFLLLLRSKTELAGTLMVTTKQGADPNSKGGKERPSMLLWSIDVQNDMYGRTVNMRAVWLLIGAGITGWAATASTPPAGMVNQFEDIDNPPFRSQRLFYPLIGPHTPWPDPVENGNWNGWTQDMYSTTGGSTSPPYGARGHLNHREPGNSSFNDENIHTPCDDSFFYTFRMEGTSSALGGIPYLGIIFKLQKPKKEHSLLGYKSKYVVQQAVQTHQFRRCSGNMGSYGVGSIQAVEEVGTKNGQMDLQQTTGGPPYKKNGTSAVYDPVKPKWEDSSQTAPKMQVTGPGSYKVAVEGKAFSVGYTMDPPHTQKWGDAVLYLQDKITSVEEISSGCFPLYITRWSAIYACSMAPADHPIQRNNGKLSKTSRTTGLPTYNTRLITT